MEQHSAGNLLEGNATMTNDRRPHDAHALVDDAKPTPWSVARERLEHPEKPRTSWLATLRPDGRPHVMPLITFWLDGALFFITSQSTRKGRNLAQERRCVITTSSTTLPSIDIVIEGSAERVTDTANLQRVVDMFGSNDWKLEIRGDSVFGPNAPSAGPPPYGVFRLVPSVVFGLPGMYGMDAEGGKKPIAPTRWTFQDG